LNQDLVARLEQLAAANHQTVFEAGNKLSHLESSLQSRLNELANALFELENKVVHLDSSVHSRLNDILNVEFPRLHEQVHETTGLLIDGRQAEGQSRATAAAPDPTTVEPFEALLERAKRDFPAVFALWRERLDATERAMRATKSGNAAHAADVYSKLFRNFVERHAAGAILDVGCGPYGRPYYLESFPDDSLFGVEPLLFDSPVGMRVVRGISEYLPWPARSFDTVISATALDHCISLDSSLGEFARILKRDGRIILWLGSNPGAKEFLPDALGFEPADEYHLFHFDIAWFEPRLEQRFRIVDRLKLDRMQYAHVFYCLVPR
jgi:SAM-dependent methyltransferase